MVVFAFGKLSHDADAAMLRMPWFFCRSAVLLQTRSARSLSDAVLLRCGRGEDIFLNVPSALLVAHLLW
jgi:hypothetical protein